MKAYKGFHTNADGTLKCLDKTYEVGETYTEDEAILCEKGMHACLEPIDVLTHYPPASSVFHVVEVDDDAQPGEASDSKVASRTLTVGAELGIAGLVEAQVEYTVSRAKPVDGGSTSEYRGAASATGYQGVATAAGDLGAASATGDQGVASATGYQGAASATGAYSIAVAGGCLAKARGSLGCGLTLAERGDDDILLGIVAVIVGRTYDGVTIEPDTYYWLHNGKIEVAE